jgi:CBS domain-containing protein
MDLSNVEIQWAKDVVNKTGLFVGATESEMTRLIAGLEKESFHTGITILFQGEISSKLCIVRSGTVGIWARQGKDKVKVAELGPNSYFGEISLLTPRAATATVKAETDTEVYFLPGEVVQTIIRNNPPLADFVNRKIEERLQSRQQALDEKK